VPEAQGARGRWQLGELLARLGGELAPSAAAAERVSQFAPLQTAQEGHLAFLASAKYRRFLSQCGATAVVLRPQDADIASTARAKIIVADPYLWYARAAQLFAGAPLPPAAVHASVCIDPTAYCAPSVSLGPGVVVEAGAQIGHRVQIGAGCFIGRDVQIGDDVRLYPRVTIYDGCEIGARSIIHSGAVIGADGFGYANDSGQWVKIPQTGIVRIAADCEIGANTTIDRGALGDTLIGQGCKLDNQIQIAHNVQIGEHTAIAACVGIAGSATIGARCQIGGGAGILGHLEIAEGTVISAMSLVSRSLATPGFYTGIFPLMNNRDWEKAAATLRRLPQLRDQIRALSHRSDVGSAADDGEPEAPFELAKKDPS